VQQEQGGGSPQSIQQIIDALATYGLRECTEEANRQRREEKPALHAFEGPGNDGVYYFCETIEDVLALFELVRSSGSAMPPGRREREQGQENPGGRS
jgi:hypothetical protein